MPTQDKIKVIVAKLGLDIHWRGAVSVARLLRDAGMEVVYLGNQFPEAIVASALQEGADVVGLSTLSGNHLTLGPKVVRLLKEKGLDDVLVVIGGTIPARDFAPLKERGLDEVFGPNTPMEEIVHKITEGVRRKRGKAAASA
ncbi:MAG TPA: cobalamin B12-binding domain-containing protein [Dehalococcoidia bacterium]|nr:cobalamin B12-binding domain-containing protein [Dehalococcoidia bacterium]